MVSPTECYLNSIGYLRDKMEGSRMTYVVSLPSSWFR